MNRELLKKGDRVWVAVGDLEKTFWLRGTIVYEDEDDFMVKLDDAPEGFPWAPVDRWSTNMRPMGVLDLIAEAAQ